MKLPELVKTIFEREKTHPYVIAFEGMIGSGKSYEAEKLMEQLGGKSQLISTDLFVSVPRTEWPERLETHDIDLGTWYNLLKIKEALEKVKKREQFTVTGLYNLANGKFDDELEIDATDCEYLILEGLLSCHEALTDFVDFKVFLNVPKKVALERAHKRDETVRHLNHSGWLEKKHIFYDHYLPYMNKHKQSADVLLEND